MAASSGVERLKRYVARRRHAVNYRVQRYRDRPPKVERPTPCEPLAKLYAAYGPGGDAPEILYLGGSESHAVSWFDWSKKPLARMIRDRVAPRRMCQIYNTAYNSEIYAAILQALGAMPNRPDVVLTHMVLRQTSPIWYENPSYHFRDDISAMERYAGAPEQGIPEVLPYPRWLNHLAEARDPAEFARYRATPVAFPNRPESTIGECLDAIRASSGEEKARLAYTFNYLHEAPDDHPRLLAAGELFRQLDSLGLDYVCYLLPQDDERGRALCGQLWDESRERKLRQTLSASGPTARFHDWLGVLPAECFFDSVEHWNQAGRELIANRMAAALAELG